jgi:hypothetical protein
MAKITLANLVLRGVRVEAGVESVRRANEVILAGRKTPATLSQGRPFAPTFGQPHNPTRTPSTHAGTAGMDTQAWGAGRLQGSAGVPASRSLARSVRYPIRLGWQLLAGPSAGSADCYCSGLSKGPGGLVGGPALRKRFARPLAA